jgi:hypothetical protein
VLSDSSGCCMIGDSSLFSAIAAGDMKAAEIFTMRFAAPLFRYCRLNFTDHFRTSEFVEEMIAVWINRIQRNETGLPDLYGLFDEAFRLSAGQWLGIRGKGLSGKQRRILEIMEEMPFTERLAIDLVLLENHNNVDVAQWLDLDVSVVDSLISAFLDTLSNDDTIKELLEHAAIHQSRERRKTAGEVFSPSKGRERQSKEMASPSGKSRPHSQTISQPIKPNARGTPEISKNTRRTSTGGRPSSDEERKKPRPRRRRVDPREIDVDI